MYLEYVQETRSRDLRIILQKSSCYCDQQTFEQF